MKKLLLSSIAIGVISAHASAATDVSRDFQTWRTAQSVKHMADRSDRVIIKYKNHRTPASLSLSTSMKKTAGLNKNVGAAFKHLKELGQQRHLLKMDGFVTLAEAKAALAQDQSIESVELDAIRFPLSNQVSPWGLSAVQAQQVSQINTGNRTVCVIDSGYQANHPDLIDNQHNGSDDKGAGNWNTTSGSHGTHVAGTIAASNNDLGVRGVMGANTVGLHIVKVFNDSGDFVYASQLAGAVQNCVEAGANVINMSLGGPRATADEREAMQTAYDAGVLLVAAAGNDGDDSYSYPASYPAVMSVAAVDNNDEHVSFSQFTDQVEIAAPGEAVLSTVAGDGRLASLTLDDGTQVANHDQLLPMTSYQLGQQFSFRTWQYELAATADLSKNGEYSGELAKCTQTGTSIDCGDMSGKICLIERFSNQGLSITRNNRRFGSPITNVESPDLDAALACQQAGAEAVLIYSNEGKPGLSDSLMASLDTNSLRIPGLSIDKNRAQALNAYIGNTLTLKVEANQDYGFMSGTSMASPHVAGVAALVWSHHTGCSAKDIRQALTESAKDIDAPGRDDKTGHGLIQAKAALAALATKDCAI